MAPQPCSGGRSAWCRHPLGRNLRSRGRSGADAGLSHRRARRRGPCGARRPCHARCDIPRSPRGRKHTASLRSRLCCGGPANGRHLARWSRRPDGPHRVGAGSAVSHCVCSVLSRRRRGRQCGIPRRARRQSNEPRHHEPPRPFAGSILASPVRSGPLRGCPLRARAGPALATAALRDLVRRREPVQGSRVLHTVANRRAAGRPPRGSARSRTVALVRRSRVLRSVDRRGRDRGRRGSREQSAGQRRCCDARHGRSGRLRGSDRANRGRPRHAARLRP